MTIKISAHCSDSFLMDLSDGKEYNGYVPSFLGRGGDDVELEIDLETGQIVGWKKPSQEVLDKYFTK